MNTIPLEIIPGIFATMDYEYRTSLCEDDANMKAYKALVREFKKYEVPKPKGGWHRHKGLCALWYLWGKTSRFTNGRVYSLPMGYGMLG